MKFYFLAVLLLFASCARPAQKGDPIVAVQEAVFRFQFDHNASVGQQRVAVYFLALGNYLEKEAIDPPDDFLARFSGNKPRVAKYSEAGRTGNDWVIDRKTKEPGIIFFVHDIRITGSDTAEAQGGYHEHSRSASTNTYTLKLGWRGWRVVSARMDGIAERLPNQPLERNADIRHARCCAPVAPAAVVAHL